MVVLHVGSGCQSNIKADCLNLLSRPAPVITRVKFCRRRFTVTSLIKEYLDLSA